MAERTSRACLLSPLTGDDLEWASTLADRALAAGPTYPSYRWFRFAQDLADYRRNHFRGLGLEGPYSSTAVEANLE